MLHSALTFKTSASPHLYDLRSVFLALHFSGGIAGLPLLIITCFRAENVPFQPELINFYFVCVLNSISYILLVFARKVGNPPHLLCFIQAAMIQGGPPTTALAIFLVVLKIWRTFRDPQSNLPYNGRISENTCSFIICSLPYVLFIVSFLISVALELKYPQSLSSSNGLYCTVYGIPFRRFSVPTLCIIFLMLMIGFEVAIGIRFYRSRKRIASSFPLAPRTMSVSIVIRVMLFNVYLCVGFGASIMFIFGSNRSWPYMVQAALPLAAFICFATQKNIILAWCFWVKGRKVTPNHSDGSIPSLRRPDELAPQMNMTQSRASSDTRTQC